MSDHPNFEPCADRPSLKEELGLVPRQPDRPEPAQRADGQPTGGRQAEPEHSSHLKRHQFQPGQSGNPGGRPRDLLSAEMARQLRAKDGAAIRAIVARLITQARAGNTRAAEILLDRTEGKLGSAPAQEQTVLILPSWMRPNQ